jgi:hypothetical protein
MKSIPKSSGIAGLAGFVLLVGIAIGCGGGGGGTSTTGTTTSGGGGTNGNSRFTGSIFIDGTATPLNGIRVQIFNSSGVLLGVGTSNSSGQYSVDIPPGTGATVFVDRLSVNTTAFYGSFYYGARTFQYNQISCRPTLPAHSADQIQSLPIINLPLRSDPPPPPPDCN